LKKPEPTWVVLIWGMDGILKPAIQIDLFRPDGGTDGSVSPEQLRAQGYEIPDLSTLPSGRHRLA